MMSLLRNTGIAKLCMNNKTYQQKYQGSDHSSKFWHTATESGAKAPEGESNVSTAYSV